MSYLDGRGEEEEEEDSGKGSDEDLEEIEQALYSQIYYQDISVGDNQEPQLFRSPGPGGDNPNSAASLSCLRNDFPESVCAEKTKVARNKHPSSTHHSGIRHGVKRKHVEIEEDSSDIQDKFVMDLLSSDSETGLDPADETSLTLKDLGLHIHVHHDETLSQSENWAIIDEDRNPMAKSGPRYYRNSRVRCINCNERGHLSKSCPQPKKLLACYLCGREGHNMRACPNPVCYNCDSVTDHHARNCPHPWRRRFDYCRRCLMRGHFQANCPDLWRQYHLTTAEGKLIECEEGGNPRVYCHNCGEQGHFGYECEGERVDRYSQPAYPFIARYHRYQQRTVPRNTAIIQDDYRDWPEEQPKKKLKLEKNIPRSWGLLHDQETNDQRQKNRKTRQKNKSSGWQEKPVNLTTLTKSQKKAKKKKQKGVIITDTPNVLTQTAQQKKAKKKKQKGVIINNAPNVLTQIGPQKKAQKNKQKCVVLTDAPNVLTQIGPQKKARKERLENGICGEIVKTAPSRRRKSKKKKKQVKREKQEKPVKAKVEISKLKKGKNSTKQGSKSYVHFQTQRGFKVTLPDLHITTG